MNFFFANGLFDVREKLDGRAFNRGFLGGNYAVDVATLLNNLS